MISFVVSRLWWMNNFITFVPLPAMLYFNHRIQIIADITWFNKVCTGMNNIMLTKYKK